MDRDYDREIEVKHRRFTDSPINFDVSSAINFVRQDDLGRILDDDDYGKRRIDLPRRLDKIEEHKSGKISKPDDNNSEFNHKLYENVEAPQEVKELFHFIGCYTPQKIDIEYKLRPFIPDFIPAVGDIDVFVKVIPPTTLLTEDSEQLPEFTKKLGLEIVDEPSPQQSNPALLHTKLRSLASGEQTLVSWPPNAKSGRDINRWMSGIQLLHTKINRFCKIIHLREERYCLLDK